MSVIRTTNQGKPWTAIPVQLIRDTTISRDARMFLIHFLSHQPDYYETQEHYRKRERIGKTKMVRIVQEARASGYLTRTRIRNDKGQSVGWQTTIHWTPSQHSQTGTVGDPNRSPEGASSKEENITSKRTSKKQEEAAPRLPRQFDLIEHIDKARRQPSKTPLPEKPDTASRHLQEARRRSPAAPDKSFQGRGAQHISQPLARALDAMAASITARGNR